MTFTIFWQLLFGLALFLYGIIHMEDALKEAQRRSFKLLLKKYTRTRFRAIVSGTAIAGVLQSSSVVNLMLLSFVGAGTISLRNALGVVLGTNIGGTFNSWLIALLGFSGGLTQILTLPLVGISGLAIILLRDKHKYVQVFKILMGIGLLLFGLEYIKESMQPFLQNFNVTTFFDRNLLIVGLAGFLLTAAVQTSAATVAIVLSALYSRVIPLEAAIAMVLGAELGTTLKIVIASLNSAKTQKQLSFANVIFNLASTATGFIFMQSIIGLIHGVGITNSIFVLVAFQTLINVVTALWFSFALDPFERFLGKYIKEDEPDGTFYLKPNMAMDSNGSIELLEKEVFLFITRVLELNLETLGGKVPEGTLQWQIKSKLRKKTGLSEKYILLKQAEGTILDFYSKLDNNSVSRENMNRINQLMTCLRNAMYAAKGLKDIRNNLREFENSGNDEKFNLYNAFCGQQIDFYTSLYEQLEQQKQMLTQEDFQRLRNTLKSDYEKRTEMAFKPVAAKKLKKIEIATVFNISRELFSSAEALVLSLNDCILGSSAPENGDLHVIKKTK